jgi:hypothetical protein
MTRNDYDKLLTELDEIFEDYEVERIIVNVATPTGQEFIIDCAIAEEHQAQVIH